MQFQSSRSTLNARMYLYDTPRDTMAKDLMLQSLCSTPTWNTPELMPNISKLYFHVFQSFMLNTNVSAHVLQSLLLNTNISSIMCFRVHAQHKTFHQHVLQGPRPTQPTYIYIYIINNWITPNIQNKSSCSCVVGYSTQHKIIHQYNHHDQYAHA